MKKSETIQRFTSKGVFPFQMAFTLLIPLRNIFLSPSQLIKRLDLNADHQVLEVGPGPGYFSIKVAQQLSKGKLVLADIQQEMLDYARRRIQRRGISNVAYYLCDGIRFQLPDESFDRIFLVTVIGEVENKEAYLMEFYRILKKGGMLSISELAGDPDKMKSEEIIRISEVAGFTTYGRYGNKNNFTLNFIKI